MKKLWLMAALLLTMAAPVRAEPIAVGYLAMDQHGVGQWRLTGQNGFSFVGFVSAWSGIFPALQVPPLVQMVDLSGYWTGLDVRGVANGREVGKLESFDYGDLRVSSGGTIPETTANAITFLSSCGLQGLFVLQNTRYEIEGFGTATISLTRAEGSPSWDFYSAVYNFQSSSGLTPNPEPMTWLLLATGLLGITALHRRRPQLARR